MSLIERSQRVKAAALSVGFTRVGITSARPVQASEYLSRWLRAGRGGEMRYLRGSRDDPAALLAGAQSVVCVALQYRRNDGAPSSDSSTPRGRVAQYVRGMDYHTVLKRKLARMVDRLRTELAEPFEVRLCVDTAPVMERQLAARAGLGWIGKNTLLLHPRDGSFAYLGEIITTLELATDEPTTDHCGTCTRCIDACPTQALTPYEMDASRCVSYLTIEHQGPISTELRAGMGEWVYGCDVCQDVCPHNARAPFGNDPDIAASRVPAFMELSAVVNMTAGDYRRLGRGTAAKRAGKKTWIRNGRIAMENAERDLGSAFPARP